MFLTVPEDADPVSTDQQDAYNLYPVCTTKATFDRDDCIADVRRRAEEKGKSLTDNFAARCEDEFNDAIESCIDEFQNSS